MTVASWEGGEMVQAIRKVLISAIGVLSLAGGAFSVDVGEMAPDFELQTSNGDTFRLSDHIGKVVFIYFIGYS
jgi:hypothetical protein